MTTKNRLLNTYVFVQLLYSARELWWGASYGYLEFSLRRFNQLAAETNGLFLIVLGILGIVGAIIKNRLCNLIYCLLNIFVFTVISLTFFVTDSKSSGGINYAIETIGAIWLAYRTKHSCEIASDQIVQNGVK